MRQYPLRVPHFDYRGRNPAKLRKQRELCEVATLVVEYINREMKNKSGNYGAFGQHDIARAINVDPALVRQVLMQFEGSDNSITVFKEHEK